MVTEVDAAAAHPIPVYSVQSRTSSLNARRQYFAIGLGGVAGFGFRWEWRDAGVVGGRPVGSRNRWVLVWWPDATRVPAGSPFGECGPELENENVEAGGAAPIFPYLFLNSFPLSFSILFGVMALMAPFSV